MDPNYDYKSKFKSIASKLKKRFLRKPNINEAIEEYTLLSKKLEEEECYGLAACCLQQVAKLYRSVGNTVSESGALQAAAHQYLNAEIYTTIETGIITFNEDLMSAISVYEEAIKLHCENNERQLAAKLCLELADIVGMKFERYFEAIPYYERAISLFTYINTNSNDNMFINHVSIQSIMTQFKLATIKIYTADYSGALTSYTDICSAIIQYFNNTNNTATTGAAATGTPKTSAKLSTASQKQASASNVETGSIKSKDFDTVSLHSTSSATFAAQQQQKEKEKPIGHLGKLLVEADISKLLLLLYLKPYKLKADQSNTLEVYSSFQTINTESHPYIPIACMDRDLFILLQSFVMACQSTHCEADVKVFIELETELWKYLNNVQNHIVNLISDNIIYSLPTDNLLFD